MGTISEEFDETRVGGGRGEGLGEEGRGGVWVLVGVIASKVDVGVTGTGETRRAVAVACGSNTFTWNEQALVNNKTSRIKFLFITTFAVQAGKAISELIQ
jgi:hypothetical protein